MSTSGRHIKSNEQVQSLLHTVLMKSVLKLLRERSWRRGKVDRKRVLRPWKFGNQGEVSLHLLSLAVAGALTLPALLESIRRFTLSQVSLVFIINSYFQSNKGENSSRKNKEMSNPGSNISMQCCN